MTFFYDLNKKLNAIESQPTQSLNESAGQAIGEAGYSAKAARAGQDIGKPGKQFAKIAKSAAERYGSEERGEKVAGAVLKKLRAKESAHNEIDEMFHFDMPAGKDRGPRDHGTDELARRADVAKRMKKPLATDPSYKDKDQYGDMYKIAGPRGRLPEGEMDEGNEFSGALAKARATGSATFKVDGKTYKVTEAELEEREFHDKETFDRQAKTGDTYRGHKGTITKTRSGETHRRRHEEEPESDKEHDDNQPKAKGRPKGTGKKIGARGPSGRSKLHSKGSIKEGDTDLHDQGEYDREGEMAKQQLHTIDSAAKELHAILNDEENLPEWVQSKITKAMDYLDTARDYMAGRDAEDAEDSEEIVPERKLTGKEKTKREEVVKSMKKDTSNFKQRYGERGEEVMYAVATKVAKGEKMKKPKKEESVEETTVSGSVATSTAEPAKKGKKGMTFGQGIYDSLNREVETLIAESMNVSVNVSSEGQKSLSVNATDEDAERLGELLQMAGLGSMHGDDDHACPGCGQTPCGCAEQVDENKPDWPTETETSDDALQYSGGLNKPKTDVAGDGQTTVPVTAVRVHEDDDLARLREMAGIIDEAKPDFLDLDKDGNKKESMKKAAADAKKKHEKMEESILDISRLWQEYKG